MEIIWPTFIHKASGVQVFGLPGGRDSGHRGQKVAEYNGGKVLPNASTQDGKIDPVHRQRVIDYVAHWWRPGQRHLPSSRAVPSRFRRVQTGRPAAVMRSINDAAERPGVPAAVLRIGCCSGGNRHPGRTAVSSYLATLHPSEIRKPGELSREYS